MIQTTKLPPDKCPCCGYPLDCASELYDRGAPSEGDLSICINCLTWLVFDANLRVRRPTPQEDEKIRGDLDLHKVRMCAFMTRTKMGIKS